MNNLRDCVLIVDDDALIADLWGLLLEEMELPVCGVAASAATAIALAQAHRPKAVLMDVRLRGPMDGVDAALAIRASVGSKIIFITGSKEPDTLARMRMDETAPVLFKPVSNRRFQATVRSVMDG